MADERSEDENWAREKPRCHEAEEALFVEIVRERVREQKREQCVGFIQDTMV